MVDVLWFPVVPQKSEPTMDRLLFMDLPQRTQRHRCPPLQRIYHIIKCVNVRIADRSGISR